MYAVFAARTIVSADEQNRRNGCSLNQTSGEQPLNSVDAPQ
jgi:hypothetical protein